MNLFGFASSKLASMVSKLIHRLMENQFVLRIQTLLVDVLLNNGRNERFD
jgi:hypothetical protein